MQVLLAATSIYENVFGFWFKIYYIYYFLMVLAFLDQAGKEVLF